MDDQKLNKLLANWQTPPVPKGLVERAAAQAVKHGQQVRVIQPNISRNYNTPSFLERLLLPFASLATVAACVLLAVFVFNDNAVTQANGNEVANTTTNTPKVASLSNNLEDEMELDLMVNDMFSDYEVSLAY